MTIHRPDGALADLLERAVLRKRRKRSGDEVEREAVEHRVRSSAAQQPHRAHGEREPIA